MQIWQDTTNAFSQFTDNPSLCAKVYAQRALEVTHWKFMLHFFLHKAYWAWTPCANKPCPTSSEFGRRVILSLFVRCRHTVKNCKLQLNWEKTLRKCKLFNKTVKKIMNEAEYERTWSNLSALLARGHIKHSPPVLTPLFWIRTRLVFVNYNCDFFSKIKVKRRWLNCIIVECSDLFHSNLSETLTPVTEVEEMGAGCQ